jgi:hypothetical protein
MGKDTEGEGGKSTWVRFVPVLIRWALALCGLIVGSCES